jgi:uncharacterized protein (DUF433 family)
MRPPLAAGSFSPTSPLLFWHDKPSQGYNTREEEAMTLLIEANPIPLRADPDGAIRVVGTRLTLDTIVTAYRDGAPPEEIAKRFPGLSLPDAYTVIGYYLRHPREVEAYLDERRRAAEAIRQKIEADGPPRLSRDQLLARRAGK